MVRVGFLQCDEIPAPHRSIDGDYPELYGRLLGGEIDLVTYRADHGELPHSPRDCDGWLIGGSRRSVYENEGWIDRLTRFAERLAGQPQPLVGICFGHQLVARALGADVGRVGWTVGAVEYVIHRPVVVAARSINIVASHQDQVLDLPANTDLLASAPGCPIAGFSNASVLTLQGHPEFSARLGASLAAARRDLLGEDVFDAALATLDGPLDSARVGGWIASFLGDHTTRSLRPAETT